MGNQILFTERMVFMGNRLFNHAKRLTGILVLVGCLALSQGCASHKKPVNYTAYPGQIDMEARIKKDYPKPPTGDYSNIFFLILAEITKAAL